jgi:hypothetical protein
VHVVLVKVIAFAAAHEIAPFWNMMKRIETHRELRVLIRLLIVRDFEIENCTVLPNPCGSDSWEARIAMSSRFLLPPLLASDDRTAVALTISPLEFSVKLTFTSP